MPTLCFPSRLDRVGFAELSPPYQATKERRKRNAGRRIVHVPHASGARGAPRSKRLAPTLRCGRARLPAFHHGTCGSERTPPLNSSYALPGTELGRNGRYPLPAVPGAASFSQAGHRPVGRTTRSRPGAEVTSLHPREPHSPLSASVTRRRPFRRDLIRGENN